MILNENRLLRYSRNIILPEIGGEGQEKLLNSKVLAVGAGGLGSPLIMYLAAAGIGHITIMDHDNVDISNLQRQIIHNMDALGKSKVKSAEAFVSRLNPDTKINAINKKIDISNVNMMVREHDIIVDGSDNFETRYLIADTCFIEKKTLVSAAITRYEGQISTWKNSSSLVLPCFRCLFPKAPTNPDAYTCSNNGVIGSLGGFLGSLQATEVIKEILGIGISLAGYLNIYDLLNNNFRKIKVNVDPDCDFCKRKRDDK